MSRTQGTPAQVSRTATDDEVESWGTVTDDDLRAWGMAAVDEDGAASADEVHRNAEAERQVSGATGARPAHDGQDQASSQAGEASASEGPVETVASAQAAADVHLPGTAESSPAMPVSSAALPDSSAVLPDSSAVLPDSSAVATDGPLVVTTEPTHQTAGETGDLGDGPAGLAPQASPAGVEAPPEHAPAGSDAIPAAGSTAQALPPEAASPASRSLPPEQAVIPAPVPVDEGGAGPLVAEPSVAHEAPAAAEAATVSAATPEKLPPIRSAQGAPLPAQPLIRNDPPTAFIGSAPRAAEPRGAVSETEPDRESDGADPSSSARRHGRPLLAAAGAAGVLLVGMPLLLLGRGHDGEKQQAQSDVPVGTVLDSAEADAGHVIANMATPSGPGKHRGPAAKSDKQPAAATSPSALLQQRKTAKHAANSSSPHGIPVHSAPKKSGGSQAPAANKPKSRTTVTSHVAETRAHATTVVVEATRTLSAGESWSATLARMTMRSDGNLVIYDEHGHVRWASNTFGPGNRAVFQGDGNLVVYNTANQPLWSSGSAGHNGAQLVLQDDGNVVISRNGAAFWSSGTQH